MNTRSTMNFTHNDHINFGWGDGFSKIPLPKTPFNIEFGKCDTDQELNWRTQCIRAASLIGNSTNLPIWLCFGGGIDAEVAFHSLRLSNVNFKVAICKFANAINDHDIKWARKICREYEIEFKEYELDIEKFLNEEVYIRAEKYKLATSHAPWHMWLAEQVDGYLIFAGGDLIIFRNEGEEQMYVKFSPQSTLIHRYLLESDREGQPYFFLHTPELIASFLLHPYIKTFVRCSKAMRMLSVKWFKPAMYFSSWPEMKYQRQKYHGLEPIEDGLDGPIREKLREKYKEYNKPKIFTYEELLEALIKNDNDIKT